ncbi:MAG TPA: Hsp20/alpha crystallin family protein [Streptosporangiaceae bacterium]
MTVTTDREVSEDLAGTAKPRERPGGAAGGHGWRVGVKHGGSAAWRPVIDISERADAYVVMVEIPGITAGEVEITMADGRLTIRGERHAAREAAGGKIHRSERGHGVFRRSVTLPSSHVNADKTEASARDGVLEILVPKAAEAQAGLIRVCVSQGNAVPAPRRDGEER